MLKNNDIQPNPITRALIDTTVERSLREIEEDPKRSIRKLTDLGRLFAKGRFTDEIYGMIQDLLHNDDSPYYTAIEEILRNTDLQTLKTFGINLGYNGLNIGGKRISRNAAERPYHTPWMIVMRIDTSIPNSMSVPEIDNVITQAKPLGIYNFGIHMEGSLHSLHALTEVLLRHDDCSFFFTLPDQKLTPIHLESIRACVSTLFLLNMEAPFAAANAALLRKQKILFGVCCSYNDKSAESWISGKRTRELAGFGTAFTVLAPEDTCSQKTMARVTRYCRNHRMHPVYPILLFDQVGDMMSVDRLNSERETGCYFELLETGDIRTNSTIITDFRHTVSLEQLLTIALPK